MNLKIVDFLDVTLNLNNNTYYPYRKPNNTPLYINKDSNHPPQVIKQLPEMINQRLCEISCNEEEFNKAKPTYQAALRNSNFDFDLKYKKYEKPGRTRKRNVMYFNPPYSENVKTNIGKEFLKLVSRHFPPEHQLHNLFNRKNLKISYSCMPNIEKIIKGHNGKIINSKPPPSKSCNCRRKDSCPLQGNCLASCLVYKAEVSTTREKKVYYGACSGTFKERFGNHKSSFRLEKYKDDTRLSQYIWKLRNENQQYEIAWSIEKQCMPYRPSSKTCDLCTTEKLVIILSSEEGLLNQRSEIANKCRHSNKFSMGKILKKLLINYAS